MLSVLCISKLYEFKSSMIMIMYILKQKWKHGTFKRLDNGCQQIIVKLIKQNLRTESLFNSLSCAWDHSTWKTPRLHNFLSERWFPHVPFVEWSQCNKTLPWFICVTWRRLKLSTTKQVEIIVIKAPLFLQSENKCSLKYINFYSKLLRVLVFELSALQEMVRNFEFFFLIEEDNF